MGGVLSGVNLDLPNTEQPQDVQDKVDRNNVKELSDKMKKTGVMALFPEVVANSATSIATSAYVDLPGTPLAFVCSGGLVEIEALLSFLTSNSGVFVKMLIDDLEVDSSIQNGSSTASYQRLCLKYRGFLVPGKHTLRVMAIGNSVAATYTPQTAGPTTSKIMGFETLL